MQEAPLRRWLFTALSLIFMFFTPPQVALAGSPTVKAILFYSPTCPHCHKVVTEDLPPLLDKYGDQLDIVGVDVSTPDGQALFQAAIKQFSVPSDRWGVPMLIVGDVVLVGDLEIPGQLPGLIDAGLAQGGIDWPEIPGLREALGELPQETAAAPATPLENLQRDPVGNSLSVIVLLAMAVSLAVVLVRLFFQRSRAHAARGNAAIPYLTIFGAIIAGYLAYVEWSGNPAACGPIGDCNAVQGSPEAILFGLIPVAWLGLMGYAAIFIVWIYGRRQGGRTESLSARVILAMAIFGTAYSMYLTYLEPFVIGATCAWCLASAVIMTLILWAAYGPAARTLRQLGPGHGARPRRASTG
jgi:uncharacterized membrane protein/thiol-disulfide isomerase/thioredoxin